MPKMYGDNGGDVIGPNSSTDNAIARFSGTTGDEIQNSTAVIGDTGVAVFKTTTNSTTGFRILNDLGSAIVEVDTTDGSGGGTHRILKVRANADVDIDPTFNIRGFDYRQKLGGAGTNTTGSRSTNFVLVCRDGMSASGVDGESLRAQSASLNWASTGTLAEGNGMNTTAFIGGGNTVNAGTAALLVGNRIRVGFQGGAGSGDGNTPLTGTITTASGFDVLSPNDVSDGLGSHVITNLSGLRIQDQKVTDVTNSFGVFIEDQSSGGYAWKSGTGLNEFGDQVVIDTTQTEAFQVRQDADAQDVFTVDTTNKTTRVNNKLVIEGAGIAIPTTEYSITKSAHVPPRLTLNTAAASNIQLAIGGGAVHFFSAAAYQTNALLASASSLNNGQMGLGATGVPLFVARNLNDALTCFQIEQRHASATGDIVQFHNSTGSVADIDVNGRLTSVGATLGGTGIIDVTNAEALLIRQVGDTGNVFSVNTLVASTAATSVNTVDIATGAGAQAGSIYSIVGINLAAKIDSGTHSAPLFGMNILTQTSDTASKTGTFGNHQTGVNFVSRHDSTGTNEEIYGVVGQTILGGPGSGVNLGAITNGYGMRFGWEYQTSGTGSATNMHGVFVNAPVGTSGTKTVTNNYGVLIENQAATGITNAWAIKTGTGLVDLGDSVFIDGSQDAIQLLVQGNATQTTSLAVFENSAGVDQITFGVDAAVVFNEQGNDADFRIEGDTDQNLFKIDASTNRVGIGTGSPLGKLQILGTANEAQLYVKGFSTQTNKLARFFSSAGSELAYINSGGGIFSAEWLATHADAANLIVARTAASATVFSVDSRSSASAGINTLNLVTAGGVQAGSANTVRGLNITAEVNSGTQSNYLNGATIVSKVSGTASKTGTSGDQQYALDFRSVHDSTGTNAEMYGVSGIITIGQSASAVNTGLITNAFGMRFGYVFQTSGTAAITNAYQMYVNSPAGTSGTHTVTNSYGLFIEDQIQTGITNAYAIQTGTGLNQFGDQLIVDGSQDIIQLFVKGHSTQTNKIVTIETSAGTDLLTIDNAGLISNPVDESAPAPAGFATGASNDLRMSHDGTDSFISNTTGNLIFQSGSPTVEAMRIDSSQLVGVNSTAMVSRFEVGGSQGRKVTTLAAATLTLSAVHDLIAVTYTGTGTVAIALPSATSAWNATDGIGRSYTIEDTGANAGTFNITINRAGSDTIINTTTGNTSHVVATNGKTTIITAVSSTTWKVSI